MVKNISGPQLIPCPTASPKCDPADFDALTEIDGVTQAPYCAKRTWVKVSDLAALRAPELERHLRRSYDLIVAGLPKKTLLTLAFPI